LPADTMLCSLHFSSALPAPSCMPDAHAAKAGHFPECQQPPTPGMEVLGAARAPASCTLLASLTTTASSTLLLPLTTLPWPGSSTHPGGKGGGLLHGPSRRHPRPPSLLHYPPSLTTLATASCTRLPSSASCVCVTRAHPSPHTTHLLTPVTHPPSAQRRCHSSHTSLACASPHPQQTSSHP
jgi:hypothetical protein